MVIPKSFSLVNRQWRVDRKENLLMETELARKREPIYGCCNSDICLIKLDKQITGEILEHTFLHELTHAILYAMGRKDLHDDEDFVDRFAALWHQFLKTSK